MIILYMYIYAYRCVYINYSTEFNIAREYIPLGLPTCDWITYQGARPWRRLILPVLASIIAMMLLLGVGPYDISSIL